MTDLNLLHSFMEVARTGNLSVAAKQLFLTQSALSQRILTLEGQVGSSLFLRRKQGMILSKVGEALLGICKDLKKDITHVDHWIRFQKGRVGCEPRLNESVQRFFVEFYFFTNVMKQHRNVPRPTPHSFSDE